MVYISSIVTPYVFHSSSMVYISSIVTPYAFHSSSMVYISSIVTPYVFHSSSMVFVPSTDSKRLRSLAVFGSRLDFFFRALMAPKKRPAAAAKVGYVKKKKGPETGLQESPEVEEVKSEDAMLLALEDEKKDLPTEDQTQPPTENENKIPEEKGSVNTGKKPVEAEAAEAEVQAPENHQKADQKEKPEQTGLKESEKDKNKEKDHNTSKTEVQPPENQQKPAKKEKPQQTGLEESQKAKNKEKDDFTQEKEEEPAADEDALSLTSTKLQVHEKTLQAVRDLKAGKIAEHDFFARVQSKDMTALWKKFEWERNKNPEAKQQWSSLGGPGVIAKKKNLLLGFLKSGNAAGGCLKESTLLENAKEDKQFFDWVPWLQLCKWYGEKEALARVEEGMVPVRKVRKFYEFLLMKDSSTLTKTQKQIIASEMEAALSGKELKACKKALKSPMEEEDWENFWNNKKPPQSFQLTDALSESDSGLEESQSAGEEPADPVCAFLKSLKSRSPPKKETKKEPRRDSKAAKAIKEEPEKGGKKNDAKKRKEEEEQKWHQKLEEMTTVEPNKMESKVPKMLSMCTKLISDFSKACKKASDSTWGSQEIKNLKSSRDELEDLLGETDLEKMKEGLCRAAKSMKAARTLLCSLKEGS